MEKPQDRTINYIEFFMTDKEATMNFYQKVFGWKFTEWGDEYISFAGAGIDGGFNATEPRTTGAVGTLVIIYAKELELLQKRVAENGGKVTRPIYPFPGGRRFHFLDPNQNELAVWSE